MASNKLQVLDHPLPLKAYVGNEADEILNTKFKFWLSNLLSIKADNEDKLDLALPVIKKKFWSLGFKEIKQAFEMYALGELQTKPIPNYFDIILVGNIFNDYKQTQQTKPIKMDEEEYKKQEDDLKVILTYDSFIQDRKISNNDFWIYTYLEHLIDASPKDKKLLFNMGKQQKLSDEDAIIKAKMVLLRRFFERLEAKSEHIKKYL